MQVKLLRHLVSNSSFDTLASTMPNFLKSLSFLRKKKENKYAIYAYTHGPVTGSGPSVKPLKYDVAPYWLS